MRVINEAEFDEMIKNGITLVDFYADWCGPCKMLAPVLEELDQEFPEINFVKVNCDEQMHLAERFSVMSIPAVFIFRDGNIIGKSGGYKGKNEMKLIIEDSIKGM